MARSGWPSCKRRDGNAEKIWSSIEQAAGKPEVDYQARLHRGAPCAAAVPDSFDHVEKAHWMTRHPALKDAVDHWLKQCLEADCYKKALEAFGEPAAE